MSYRLEHFVAAYDQEWDYKSIAEELFDGPRILVMEEKVNGNHHVHFQGETSMAETTFSDKMGELAKTHHQRKRRPGARPVRRHKRGPDEVGFQYMCKEGNPPLFSRGFSEQELEELIAKAQGVMLEHKEGVYNHLLTMRLNVAQDPESISFLMFMSACNWLKERDRKISKHTKMDVYNAMMYRADSTEAMKKYVWRHL